MQLSDVCSPSQAEPDRPQTTTKYDAEKMRFACRVTKTRIQAHT